MGDVAAGLQGRLISRALAQRGLSVVLADTNGDAATQVLEELPGLGHQFVETDASNADAVRRLMAQAGEVGTIKVLINNAGGWLPGDQYPDAKDWRRSLDLNLVMPMLACQLALPLMTGQGGRNCERLVQWRLGVTGIWLPGVRRSQGGLDPVHYLGCGLGRAVQRPRELRRTSLDWT